MKKILVLVITGLFILQVYSQGVSALFIGNSYTYYNGGVGLRVQQIAESMGDEFTYQMVAPGGYQLWQQCIYTPTLEAIALGTWDYVVIQEQSQMPSFPPVQVETDVYPYAAILCDSIYSANPCAIPMFFMTWGREFGDQDNCPDYPPLCTFEGMQQRLRDSYIQMALDNEAQVAPVGIVWKTVRDSLDDNLDLYIDDNSHPTLLGTYLAACTFYASMFHKSPVGAMFPEGVDADEALAVQEYATSIVFDSLDTWLIDTVQVRADFEAMYLTKDILVNGYFQNWSENADSCYWDFGDGEFEWQYPYNPNQWDMITHSFPEEDYYEICLTAYSGCKTDNYCELVYVFPQNIPQQTACDKNCRIFPNPASDKISVIFAEEIIVKIVKIIDATGRTCVLCQPENFSSIDVSKLGKGYYVVIIETSDNIFKRSFIKN